MRIFSYIALLVLTSTAFGQSREKLYFSASLNPVISMAINTSSSDKLTTSTPPQTLKQYQDSIRSFESYKLSLGGTIWVNYMLNSKWSIQTGIGYSEIGFSRHQENIQLNDRLFPGVGSKGRLLEFSNSEKSVDYRLRYQYLSVPVLFNYYKKRSGDFKWTYYFTGGVGLNFLVHHEMKAVLNQFVVEGEEEFHIDSTGYEGSRFAINLFAGGRIDYKVDKALSVFVQPMATIFPVSVSKTEMHSYPLGLQVNLGVSYLFEKAKDEKN